MPSDEVRRHYCLVSSIGADPEKKKKLSKGVLVCHFTFESCQSVESESLRYFSFTNAIWITNIHNYQLSTP